MPTLWVLMAMLLTAGAPATGANSLGPDSSQQRTECVEQVSLAPQPTTVGGIRAILKQCRERFP